jgi:thymidylate synthase (FAD)
MNRPELLQKWAHQPVLDHGHVKLVDLMGDDERIEEVARLSYQRGTRKKNETRGLLRYLLKHRHTSPFEQVAVTLDMKLPIFVARQLIRHRTQKLNEMSGRYSVLPEEFYLPELEQICLQNPTNKQGRAEPLPYEDAVVIRERMKQHCEEGFLIYRDLLDKGVARETARIHLPLNTYTQWCTTWDGHNLLHMLELRMDAHAQWEIRQYAHAIALIVQDWLPITWEAFEDFRLEAITLSRQERRYVRLKGPYWGDDLSDREQRDLMKKFGYEGMKIPPTG